MAKTKLFLRKSKVNGDGESIIFVRYSHGDKTVDFSTGERVPAQYWDHPNQRVRKSFPGHSGINNYIDHKRNEIDSIRLDLKTRKIDPTVDAVRREFTKDSEPSVAREINPEIMHHWSEFIAHQRDVKRLAESTLKQYNLSKNVLESFQIHIGSKLTFDMINQSFMNDFTRYLYGEKKYTPNSLGGRVKHLKTFLEWAVSKDLTTNIKFKKFKKPGNETTIITLTQSELDTLYYLDLSSQKRLERVRDIFILGCATGLRYSDYSVLVSANFREDYIIISTEKMDKQVRIPMNDYSRAVIKKYPNGLPRISNINLNKYIKEVGILAKFFTEHEVTTFKSGQKQKFFKPLYSLLTSHCARRTFATQSLQRGMQMTDVMKITGHKDVRSFMRYVHVAEPRLKEEVTKAWNTLK